jgi:hypothetical protein
MKPYLWVVTSLWLLASRTEAFRATSVGNSVPRRFSSTCPCFALQEPERSNDIPVNSDTPETEEETLSEADARLSDILPPAVSFSRNSILFSERPVTQRNNEILTFWRGMKSIVPPIFTGAWPWRDPFLADENPVGALYNILFVRLPVIGMGLVYSKNLNDGHPFIIDYGDGPVEVPPLAVLLVFAIILA